ncbi:hypothetical protein [Cryobacterium sp. AP23]
MSDPLEDSDARKLLLSAGVVFRAGQASRILDEASPLLAAEGFDVRGGFDLRGPEPVDVDAFRAAIVDAVERINLERFTPIGVTRSHALSLIGVAVLAMCVGDADALNDLVMSVEAEPADTARASVPHVIGVCLGRLDTWYADPRLRAEVAGTRTSSAIAGLSNATRDILARASGGGRAFSSLETLLQSHGSPTLLLAALFAVAATLAAWSEHDGTAMDTLVRGVMTDQL